MIDHIGFSVSDLDKARKFYELALAPLGIAVLMDVTPEMTGGENFTWALDRIGHFSGLARDASMRPASMSLLQRPIVRPWMPFIRRQ